MSCTGFGGIIFLNHLCIVLVDSTFLRLGKSQQKISEMHRHSNRIWSRRRAFDLLLYLCWICVTQANACTLVRRADKGEGWTVFRILLFIQDSREFTVTYCTWMLVKTVHFKYIELLFKSKLWMKYMYITSQHLMNLDINNWMMRSLLFISQFR